MINKKYLLLFLISVFLSFSLFATEQRLFISTAFLGKWEFDFQKTYENNLNWRQMSPAQQERLKILMAGRKIEILANGEIINTFKENPKSEKIVSSRVKCKVIKSSPTELLLEGINEPGDRVYITINSISNKYIYLFSVQPGELESKKIRYYYKKIHPKFSIKKTET